jgi:hypothetical protein
VGALAVVGLACALGTTAIRRQTPVWKRRLGWVLLLAMALCFSVGCFLIVVVVLPTNDALDVWVVHQDQAMQAQGCSAAIWRPVFDRAFQTIGYAQDAGGALAFLGLLLLFVLGWRYPLRNTRAATSAV